MVEPGSEERIESCFVERQARSNQTDVKTRSTRRTNKFDYVCSRERLSAREVRLQNTNFGRLPEYGRPSLGGKLSRARGQLARI